MKEWVGHLQKGSEACPLNELLNCGCIDLTYPLLCRPNSGPYTE